MVTVRGYYDGKVVKLLEPAPDQKPGEVTVSFDDLELIEEERARLAEVPGFGGLKDDRSAEEIIAELRAARTQNIRGSTP